MTTNDEHGGLIATEVLSLDNVPSPDADVATLEAFCLTVDGYEGELHSIDHLVREAERVERSGLETATLDDLRSAAFIRQRQLRWSTYGDENADAPPGTFLASGHCKDNQ